MNNDKISPVIPVILSGGAGTRLWPLSRETAPKPFMPLPDGETLLAKTAHRAASLAGVTGLVTVTNRDYYFRTKDVYAGLGADEPRDAAYLLEPFGRNTAPAVALAALLVQCAPRLRRGHAGARRRPPDPRRGGVRRRGDARRRTGARRTAGHVRHHAHASGNRLRLHRVRQRHRGPRLRRDALRGKAAARAGARLSRRRQLCLELRHVRVHGGHDPRGVRALCARGAGCAARRCGSRSPRKSGERVLEIDAATFAAAPEHLDRLRGDGAGGRRRQGRRRARRLRLERRRLVAGDLGTVRRRRPRQPRQRRARRHRHARHVRPFRGPRRRHDRRREPGHRRHARRRAGRAPRSPAAGQGRGRRTEGARPRFLQAAQDRRAAVGHLHGARGRARDSRSSASRSSPADRCRCNCIIAAASTGWSCAAPRA